MKPWTKTDPLSGRFIRQQPIIVKRCPCGSAFRTIQGRIDSGRGKFCSKNCMYMFRTKRGPAPNARYSAIHKWIAANYGQTMICKKCGIKSHNPYQIHWANLDGEYSRDITTWMRLCAKCHYQYDRVGI